MSNDHDLMEIGSVLVEVYTYRRLYECDISLLYLFFHFHRNIHHSRSDESIRLIAYVDIQKYRWKLMTIDYFVIRSVIRYYPV